MLTGNETFVFLSASDLADSTTYKTPLMVKQKVTHRCLSEIA